MYNTALSNFYSTKTYKDILCTIKQIKKIYVPKRKIPGINDYSVAAYADKVALLTIDRNPLDGFDMDYIIFDCYDSKTFFENKLVPFSKKYNLKGLDIKVSENKYIRFNIDDKYQLAIPKY